MEVKPGYKQTEVGLIPRDWDVSTIGELANTSSGTTPLRALADRYYKNGTVAWVKTLDLNNGFISETDEKVTQTAINETCLAINPVGTVLVAMYGGFKQIGRTGLLSIPATVNQAITAIRTDSNRLIPDYLLRQLNYRIDYWKSVASSSRKDPNITGREIREFPIAVPDLSEQEAIAGALSDADALIESLEQLVAKKRQVKLGAMQELLTGQKRLPGFEGEWETKPLHIVLKKGRLGGNYPNQDNETPFPLMKMGNVGRGYFDLSKVEYIKSGIKPEMVHRLMLGDVLFNTRNTLDLVGKVAIWRDELPVAYYNSNLMRLEFDPTQVCSNEYASAAFNSERVVSRLREMATGTTSVAAIYTRDLMKLQFVVPPLQEQTAIADVLSAMDAEIVELERKLAKARLVKAGMMQELLTGKTRLVKPRGTHA